jgi:hypothetical protein
MYKGYRPSQMVQVIMEPVEGRTGPGQGLWFTAPAIGKVAKLQYSDRRAQSGIAPLLNREPNDGPG